MTKMTKWVRNGVGVMALAVCSLTVEAVAQQSNASQSGDASGQVGPGGRRGGPGRMEDRQIEMMTKHLNLTPDQAAQVKAIDEAQRTQMMAMRQERESKIRAVLTDEQKTKYDVMQAKMKERMDHGRGGFDGPPPPPPPAQ